VPTQALVWYASRIIGRRGTVAQEDTVPHDHEHFMRAALHEAAKGLADGNIAVGSVVVRDDAIVGRGRNLIGLTRNPTDDAETVAMSDAARTLGRADLTGCTLYTTVECCPMCCGAAIVSGISTLVLGMRFKPDEFPTQRFGGYSVEQLIELAGRSDRLRVVTGILTEECLALRREWAARQKTGRQST
jgi:tRNA(adenine34) deaminase